MFIFKNAWISITRNKGRNILIGIIVLVTFCASTIALAISNTASNLISSYENAYSKEATISFDRSSMMKDRDITNKEGMESAKEAFSNISSYSINDVISYADSEYVNSYYYTYKIGLNGENIEKTSTDFSFDKRKGGNKEVEDNMPEGITKGGSSTDFILMGYSSVDSMSEFITGTYTMSEITDNAWDVIFDGKYVFINEELASLNSIKLNDVIKLNDGNGNVYEFTVLGIYTENSTSAQVPTDMFSSSSNTIITNADVLVDITSNNENVNGTVTPVFILNSYDYADAFESELYTKGLSDSFVVETNEEEASAAVESIYNVKSFVSIFLAVTLIIGGVVLFVINMINIRERKYEIGVLRTIGISKVKLTMQFIVELCIVTMIALVIGATIGAIASKPVSNMLLANEINSSKEATEQISNNFGKPNGDIMGQGEKNRLQGKGIVSVQAYESIDAVVDFKVLFELFGISLSLVLVSSIASMISIQRFSPLTILKERS